MMFLNDSAHKASSALADEKGVFPNWSGSVWADRGLAMRNACVTTVAPTGSLSIIANCSAGMEPLFAVVFKRHVLEGQTMIEANGAFGRLARARGFYRPGLMEDVLAQGSLRGVAGIPDNVQAIFATAHDITPAWHVRMQAAFQKHCDASISKTVNMPRDATSEDVRRTLLLAYDQGCKGVTVYRDGCRSGQPMSVGSDSAGECSSGRCATCAS
jgi:ribonucleoside-diphosphate reductase alpha chain